MQNEVPDPYPSSAEDRLISRILAQAGAHEASLRVPPGDDAAVLEDGTVLATDALVEGVHFDERFTPADVGWKLAMVNASDIAAMGARARWALLVLALPEADPGWVTDLARGLAEGLRAAGAQLVGGDTVRTRGAATLALTLAGRLEHPPLRRDGGRPGDDLWVSGTLGGAARDFRSAAPPPDGPLRRPRPPLALGPALASGGLASAAIDLSDGLARDLHRLARACRCGARVDFERLPLAPGLGPDPLPLACGWGEDFELLFAAPPAHRAAIASLGERIGVRLARVGCLEAGHEIRLVGAAWPVPWAHFAEETSP